MVNDSNDTSEFTQTGGARIGRSYWWSFNATIPFAKIQIRSDALILTCLSKKHSFSKQQIQAISIYSGVISTGVQIHHSNPNCPPFVVFWTFHLDELVANLQAFGYEVSGK